MKEENHNEERLLIAKNLSGEANAVEKKALSDWIAAREENEKVFQESKKAFELSGRYRPDEHKRLDIDVDQEWNKFIGQAEKKSEGKTIEFPVERKASSTMLRIAAAVLIIVASGLVINYFVQSGEQVYETAQNTQTVILPDGSKVFLNRNSKLTYSKSYGTEGRNVLLSGEAFFEVESDPQNPFFVQLDEAEITVLGTSFNIQAYGGQANLEVTVETGVVKFAPKEIKETLELRAGEKGVFEKTKRALVNAKNEDANYLAWKTRKIVFEASSLASVVKALESAYGITIAVSASVSAACEVTVTFDNQSLDAVLNVLKSTLDLTYKQAGDRLEITKAGC